MRRIILDNEEVQIQSDEQGQEYVFRKDYLYKGGMNEYSLALIYSRMMKGKS